MLFFLEVGIGGMLDGGSMRKMLVVLGHGLLRQFAMIGCKSAIGFSDNTYRYLKNYPFVISNSLITDAAFKMSKFCIFFLGFFSIPPK